MLTGTMSLTRISHSSETGFSCCAGSWEAVQQGWDGYVSVWAGAKAVTEAETKAPYPLLQPWNRLTGRLKCATARFSCDHAAWLRQAESEGAYLQTLACCWKPPAALHGAPAWAPCTLAAFDACYPHSVS